ncbi:hypothetical protein BH18THE2_BH18THE2_41750 [soil metagenome]
MSNKQNNNIIHIFNQWITAFKAHDISKMALLLTENVRINSITFGNYKGKDGATKYWQELYNAFPDIKINPVTVTADHKRIMTEMEVSGTQKGQLGGSPPFSKKFHIRGAFVYEFAENRIKEIRMYYDSGILRRQLNILKI